MYEKSFVVGKADGEVLGSWITTDLNINIKSVSSGELCTYIGLSEKTGAGLSFSFDNLQNNYSYHNNPTTPDELFDNIIYKFGEGEQTYTQMVLGITNPVEINKNIVTLYTSGIEISMHYVIQNVGSETIIRPLNFLYDQWIQIAINAINIASVLFSGKNAFAVHVKITTPPSISFIPSSDDLSHIRTPLGESKNYDVRYSAFVSTSNDIKVVDNLLISPIALFVILVILMVVSTSLVVYGRRHKYKTYLVGVILLFIFGFVVYFCAFIPGSSYLVYLFGTTGIILPIIGIVRGRKLQCSLPQYQQSQRLPPPQPLQKTPEYPLQSQFSAGMPSLKREVTIAKVCPTCFAHFTGFLANCDKCGAKILYCKECGMPKKETDKFCKYCGK